MEKDLIDDYKAFLVSFNNESHRGRVIIAHAYLDAMLQKLLENYFMQNPSEINSLFDGNFVYLMRKIDLAYSLKLIDKDVKHNLIIINKIRNKFAHSMYQMDFNEKQIENLCKELTLPIPFEHFDHTSIDRFMFSFYNIHMILTMKLV